MSEKRKEYNFQKKKATDKSSDLDDPSESTSDAPDANQQPTVNLPTNQTVGQLDNGELKKFIEDNVKLMMDHFTFKIEETNKQHKEVMKHIGIIVQNQVQLGVRIQGNRNFLESIYRRMPPPIIPRILRKPVAKTAAVATKTAESQTEPEAPVAKRRKKKQQAEMGPLQESLNLTQTVSAQSVCLKQEQSSPNETPTPLSARLDAPLGTQNGLEVQHVQNLFGQQQQAPPVPEITILTDNEVQNPPSLKRKGKKPIMPSNPQLVQHQGVKNSFAQPPAPWQANFANPTFCTPAQEEMMRQFCLPTQQACISGWQNQFPMPHQPGQPNYPILLNNQFPLAQFVNQQAVRIPQQQINQFFPPQQPDPASDLRLTAEERRQMRWMRDIQYPWMKRN